MGGGEGVMLRGEWKKSYEGPATKRKQSTWGATWD